jgi:hypothetical protein
LAAAPVVRVETSVVRVGAVDVRAEAHLHVVWGVGNQNKHTVALLERAREWYMLKITGVSQKIHPALARPPTGPRDRAVIETMQMRTSMCVCVCVCVCVRQGKTLLRISCQE